MVYVAALLIGIVAGLRAMTAPAAVALGASLGKIHLVISWAAFAAFLSSTMTAIILVLLALVEFVTDQLPTTPSRKAPMQFGARLVSGGVCGAALGATAGAAWGGLAAGVVGAVIGTFGGAEGRARLATAFAGDRPAALIEDAAAILMAALAVSLVG